MTHLAGIFFVFSILCLVSCNQKNYYDQIKPFATEDYFVTFFHLYKTGQDKVYQYLNETENQSLLEKYQSFRKTCVFIEATTKHSDTIFFSTKGSGVIVTENKYIFTAGHLLNKDIDKELTVVLNNGDRVKATVLKSSIPDSNDPLGGDWAILKIQDYETNKLPHLNIGEFNSDDQFVFCIGYPGGIGFDNKGIVGNYRFSNKLNPVTVIGLAEFKSNSEDKNLIKIKPKIGSMILGGMSGGPIINFNGELIGILIQTQERYDSKNHYDVSFNGTNIRSFFSNPQREVKIE